MLLTLQPMSYVPLAVLELFDVASSPLLVRARGAHQALASDRATRTPVDYA